MTDHGPDATRPHPAPLTRPRRVVRAAAVCAAVVVIVAALTVRGDVGGSGAVPAEVAPVAVAEENDGNLCDLGTCPAPRTSDGPAPGGSVSPDSHAAHLDEPDPPDNTVRGDQPVPPDDTARPHRPNAPDDTVRRDEPVPSSDTTRRHRPDPSGPDGAGQASAGPVPPPVRPPGAGVRAPGAAYAWPLHPVPTVAAPFRRPTFRFGRGHRGADLVGVPGQAVLAAREGTVVFAGRVADRPVVSVDHPDGLRTTYEPVVATVHVGDRLVAGDPLGVLVAGHAGCSHGACLHWGVRRGKVDYLDPLVLVRPPRVRLLPWDGVSGRPRPTAGHVSRRATAPTGHAGA